MKKWENPELNDLLLKATKQGEEGDVKCPYASEGKSRICGDDLEELWKKRCCGCCYYNCCKLPWKYQGSCDIIS